jgi:citrate lyase subunit beta / citryl-CoA lyase
MPHPWREAHVSSMLYVPGGDERKLAKAAGLDVPAIILDLEDAVAASAKAAARVAVAGLLRSGQLGRAWVRVNAASASLLYEDLHAVVVPQLDGLVLPKVEAATDVQRIDWLVGVLEERAGIPAGRVFLLPTIETVKGLANVDAIATASRRVLWLGFGAGDFSLDLGLEWPTSDGSVGPTLLAAKSEIVLASRRAGLAPPHDGSFPRFRDEDGLRQEARLAKSLGFGCKHAIHPDQVPVIEEIFYPSAAEIERSREIVLAFSARETAGVANVAHDGTLVDYPVALRAARLLRALGLDPEVTAKVLTSAEAAG